ncbi:MAG: hypothetical protein WD737_02425 [Gemmatimonadota bacterium]
MTDGQRIPGSTKRQSMMDELLRAGVPEIKFALGEVIDRENQRPLPARYARLLPETLLVVTLRTDAAQALEPIASGLERELTDSCNRHGSLYDRAYRVQLQESHDPDAPLYTVSSHSGRDVGGPPPPAAAPDPERHEAPRALPVAAPDSTAHTARPVGPGWEPGRWVLVVEGGEGEEREAFRLGEPTTTVGRRTDDPEVSAAIAISDAPNVSRRQLALVWEERDGAPGFAVFNLGLNAVHLPELEIPGARAGKGRVDLDTVDESHRAWLPPGLPLRIGEHGPVIRVEEIPDSPDDGWVDPDATVFD